MTTPAHCTRTWTTAGVCPANVQGAHLCELPRGLHHTHHVCACGNEPPADVAATPDPRLDVVERVLAADDVFAKDTAQCVLDALDAMRPKEHRLGDLVGAEPNLTGGLEPGEYLRRQYAPAGLTPAQEIRLRVFETGNWTDGHTIDEWAAWVEHGGDETPASRWEQRALRIAAGRDAEKARADLAEARLAEIAEALADLVDKVGVGTKFEIAVRDALAWTPDDTATAAVYCGECGADRSPPKLNWICPDCGRLFCAQTCQYEHTKLGVCPSPAIYEAACDNCDQLTPHEAPAGCAYKVDTATAGADTTGGE